MKRPIAIVSLITGLTLAVFLVGCGGGGGGGGGGTSSNSSSANTPTTTVTGTVYNVSTSQPLANVVVTVGSTGLTGTTNSTGFFSIADVPDVTEVFTFDLSGGTIATQDVSASGTMYSLGTINVSTSNFVPPPPSGF